MLLDFTKILNHEFLLKNTETADLRICELVEFEGPEKQRLLSSLRWTFHPGGENSKLPEKKIEENLGSHDRGEGNNKEKFHTQ